MLSGSTDTWHEFQEQCFHVTESQSHASPTWRIPPGPRVEGSRQRSRAESESETTTSSHANSPAIRQAQVISSDNMICAHIWSRVQIIAVANTRVAASHAEYSPVRCARPSTSAPAQNPLEPIRFQYWGTTVWSRLPGPLVAGQTLSDCLVEKKPT